MKETTIIELNDAIMVIDNYLSGFGKREVMNMPIGEIKKSDLLNMRKGIQELRLHRIEYLSELVKGI